MTQARPPFCPFRRPRFGDTPRHRRAATGLREAFGVRRLPALLSGQTWRDLNSAGIRRTPNASRRRSVPISFVALFSATQIACSGTAPAASSNGEAPRTFPVKGVVEQIKPQKKSVTIRHEAITNYMAAMTMAFRVLDTNELTGLRAGDAIAFQLHVTDKESWIDQIRKSGAADLLVNIPPPEKTQPPAMIRKPHPLMDYKFTNELNQPVRLGDFHGQALAITFFFTRCPIPEYCPRLSKNFQEASAKLSSTPEAPTNWHFLSVTFDPEFDSPRVLKAYGETYHYDPAHWSFLTGPSNQVAELARESDVKFDRDGIFYNHNFRTLIVDANGKLQMVFPLGGDLSEAIVEAIRKAAHPENVKSN